MFDLVVLSRLDLFLGLEVEAEVDCAGAIDVEVGADDVKAETVGVDTGDSTMGVDGTVVGLVKVVDCCPTRAVNKLARFLVMRS